MLKERDTGLRQKFYIVVTSGRGQGLVHAAGKGPGVGYIHGVQPRAWGTVETQ